MIKPSIAAGFVASGIWRSQTSQLWPVSARRSAKAIEPAPLLGQQPAGQPTFDLSSRLMTQVDAEAFEGSGWRDDDPALPAFLDNEPGENNQPVTLNRMRQQRVG